MFNWHWVTQPGFLLLTWCTSTEKFNFQRQFCSINKNIVDVTVSTASFKDMWATTESCFTYDKVTNPGLPPSVHQQESTVKLSGLDEAQCFHRCKEIYSAAWLSQLPTPWQPKMPPHWKSCSWRTGKPWKRAREAFQGVGRNALCPSIICIFSNTIFLNYYHIHTHFIHTHAVSV